MSSERGRILVIDDEEHVRNGLQRILTADGYDVAVAATAAQALEEALRDHDVALVDYELPDMNGVELASRLRVLHPHMVRMMLTAQKDFSVAQQAVNAAQVFRYLVKPCDPATLRIEVALALSESRRRRKQRGEGG